MTSTRTIFTLKALAALFVLNALLSMTNWWPTPFVHLDSRMAPEFMLLWVVILLVVWRRGALSPRWLTWLTVAYFVLVAGRYFDTTAPALFGRSINLYWDTLQIPRVMWVTLRGYSPWITVGIVLAVLLLIVMLYRLIAVCIRVTGGIAAPYALRAPWVLVLTAFVGAVAVANVYGVRATWPYVSRPVIPTYWRQAMLLVNTVKVQFGGDLLPASPAFTSDLGALKGLDVDLFFLESYGRIVFEKPEAREPLTASRNALAAAIRAQGKSVVSAYVGSTTFAGGSELAHVALLSGIDSSDPMRHDVLITTQRPTLVTHFRARGYETFGFYPGLTWDWPEKKFYGFEHFLDQRDLGYRGPKLGYWTVPDQYALARFAELHPVTAQSRPRLTFFPSITSHMPFHPVPPYVDDWRKILQAEPFTAAQMAAVQAQKLDWFNMFPGYVGMIDYNYRWLAGYVSLSRVRDNLLIVMGDHQPAANVSGEGASWDVPIHIIARDPALLTRFTERGFVPGLEPQGKRIGNMSDLTRVLLDIFDSGGSVRDTGAPASGTTSDARR